MKPLSPHYRNDDIKGLEPDVRQYLDEHYLPSLKNASYNFKPKLLVVFSGGNAMGKSTISRLIEERFHALVLENDEVRRLLKQILPIEADRALYSQITWRYTMHLYENLPKLTTNGLVVRDGVIDWYYDKILPIFEGLGYGLFIISFELSKKKQRELIERRGDTDTFTQERGIALLVDHEIHQARFRAHYAADVVLTDDDVFDQKKIMVALERKLAELS